MNARNARMLRLFLGMLAGGAAGVALCLLVAALEYLSDKFEGGAGPRFIMGVVYPSLAIIPFLMGLAAALVWKPLKLGVRATVLHSFLCSLLCLAGAAIVFKEGIVCLIIFSPLLYIFLLTGALLGRVWFHVDRTKLNISFVPLLVLLVAGEPFFRSDDVAVVTDEILIHAPPQQVWPHVISFPDIAATPKFWLFRAGLPMPMSTTSAGDFAGADRRCIFSGGAVFKEKVAEIVPYEKLTFDIVESPRDPELIGHLTAQRGQFELRDNRDGTTTLTGRTWYVLHVRPLWYFDWWTRYIFRAVHLRVMENVREMSERRG